MNDTGKKVEIRLNIDGMLPTGFSVDNGKFELIHFGTNQIFVKLWGNNTVLFQDMERNSSVPKEGVKQ